MSDIQRLAHQIIANISCPLALLDTRGRILCCNQHVAEFLGSSIEHLVDKSICQMLLTRDNRNCCTEKIFMGQRCRLNQNAPTEVWIQPVSGQRRCLRLRLADFPNGGDICYSLGIEDITAEQVNQSRLSSTRDYLRQRAQLLTSLNQAIGNLILDTGNSQNPIRATLGYLCRGGRFSGARYMHIEQNPLRLVTRMNYEAIKAPENALELDLISDGLAEHWMQELRTSEIISANTQDLPEQIAAVLRDAGVQFFILIPVTDSDERTSGLILATDLLNRRYLRPEDVHIFSLLGLAIGAILERNRHQHELEQLNHSLEARVRAEVEANRQKEQLLFQQSRLAQMGEMLNMIAHQWRQPLTAVSTTALNLSFAAQTGSLDPDVIDEACRDIETQTTHMSSVIEDFLAFVHPREQHFGVVNVRSLVVEVLNLMSAQLDRQGIEVTLELDSQLTVHSSRTELKQVLINIICNARDALEDIQPESGKTRHIQISAWHRDGQIGIAIRDTGPGIPEDILERVFEPYFTTKDDERGTGIGLYMARQIVERRLGGYIDALNVAQSGACFQIRIPT